ncbi:MAG TPA: hypothetical protein VGC63_08025 [Solirubrobacterales bacterium]|jgi:hypothetical protein
MFRCDQCHTEYGGIRGIASGRCARCRPDERIAIEARHSKPSRLVAAWPSTESPPASWSPLPLLGPIAQLDAAARI